MRIGIFGDGNDPQCAAVAHEAAVLGAEAVIIDSEALEHGWPLSMKDDETYYLGQRVDDLRGFYLRFVPAPFVPALEQDGELVLYEDWHHHFMQTRERASYFVAWLLKLAHQGATLVNGPHAASVMQYKHFQLHALRSLGARVPRTLISNDPAAIRAFHAEVKDVIFKPIMGGAVTRGLDAEALERLEDVTASPSSSRSGCAGTTCASCSWATRWCPAWQSRRPSSTSTSGRTPSTAGARRAIARCRCPSR